MKYNYQFHDGEKWISVIEQEFDTALDAKRAGIEAGFEQVRIVFADRWYL